MAPKAASAGDIYQLKITLASSQPPIWRRILLAPTTTLEELHLIIQTIMPWHNSHLHSFEDQNHARYSDLSFELEDVEDEAGALLGKVLTKSRSRMLYEYDFGDSWEHLIQLEKTVSIDEDQPLPFCTAGKRAAPPEDCGGIWGYVDMLVAIKDRRHSNHQAMLEWAGEHFDPEAFDVDETNRALKKLKL